MRTVRYNLLPPVGNGELHQEGSLIDFVLEIPYLFSLQLIPPPFVFNEIFRSGIDDAGMSGGWEWQPFEISQKEYEELVNALSILPEANYKYIAPPEWVKNREEWHIWCQEYTMDIPHEEYYSLWLEENKWDKLKQQARENGDEERMMEYHLKGLEAGRKVADFIMPYIERYRDKKDKR